MLDRLCNYNQVGNMQVFMLCIQYWDSEWRFPEIRYSKRYIMSFINFYFLFIVLDSYYTYIL